jgi:hypothetical protein
MPSPISSENLQLFYIKKEVEFDRLGAREN